MTYQFNTLLMGMQAFTSQNETINVTQKNLCGILVPTLLEMMQLLYHLLGDGVLYTAIMLHLEDQLTLLKIFLGKLFGLIALYSHPQEFVYAGTLVYFKLYLY